MKTLKMMGFSCKAASNGREAIELMSTQPFDLILMDCQMPEMDGYEATIRLRASQALEVRSVPIIALTASAIRGDRERCLEAGMSDYLSKPVKRPALEQMLVRWLFDAPTRQTLSKWAGTPTRGPGSLPAEHFPNRVSTPVPEPKSKPQAPMQPPATASQPDTEMQGVSVQQSGGQQGLLVRADDPVLGHAVKQILQGTSPAGMPAPADEDLTAGGVAAPLTPAGEVAALSLHPSDGQPDLTIDTGVAAQGAPEPQMANDTGAFRDLSLMHAMEHRKAQMQANPGLNAFRRASATQTTFMANPGGEAEATAVAAGRPGYARSQSEYAAASSQMDRTPSANGGVALSTTSSSGAEGQPRRSSREQAGLGRDIMGEFDRAVSTEAEPRLGAALESPPVGVPPGLPAPVLPGTAPQASDAQVNAAAVPPAPAA